MNTKIKGKGKLTTDYCDNTSASYIINCIIVYTSDNANKNDIFEVSQTERKETFVGFDHELSILTRDSATEIDLTNGDVIKHINGI